MDNQAAPIAVEGLAKRFRQGAAQIAALSDVDLTIAPGEFVAVMGASGSGKSTLLHLMAGLTSPDEGRVLVDGHDLAGMSDYRLTMFRRSHIGLVFQSFNLIPALTAEENILLPLRASAKRVDHHVDLDSLLDLLGLADRRHHRPNALSGGEQQRVAIARALITQPTVVLADEPTGNLDSQNSQKLCGVLRQLNEGQRRAIVVVTHESNVAMWADRIVVLQDGELRADFDARGFESPQALASYYSQLTSSDAESPSHARV